MCELLIDNMFTMFDGRIFQQIVGIPMGTNCAYSSGRLVSLFAIGRHHAWASQEKRKRC